MSSHALFSQRPYSAPLSRLIWPMAILLIATLGSVVLTIRWTSDNTDASASDRERTQFAAAVEQKVEDLKTHLTYLAADPGLSDLLQRRAEPQALYERFGRRAARHFGFYGSVLVAHGGRVLSGMEDGAPAPVDVDGVLKPWLDRAIEAVSAEGDGRASSLLLSAHDGNGAVGRVVAHAGEVRAVVATAIPVEAEGTPRTERVVAIAYKRLDGAVLQRIADLHGMTDFKIMPQDPGPGRIGLPLHDGDGKVQSVLTWKPDRPGEFMRERVVPLTLFGAILAVSAFGFLVATVRRIGRDLSESQRQTRTLIGHDPLSGLANRLLFGERLDQELSRIERGGGGLSVLVLDLDRFKEVNDTFGHQAGDALIVMVAQRLTRIMRSHDTLARFGGDEFAIIQTNVAGTTDTDALTRRIFDAITEPFEVNGSIVTIGVSIGVALAPEHGRDRELLMRLADTALYQSKSAGRNRCTFFVPAMDETIRMRKLVEDELRDAIANDSLTLHYQPIFSADGRTVVGLEALVRWEHPEQGLISPARFIAIAEERGLVIPLGEWVLRRACLDGRRWPGLRIAVNVSAVQFRHRDFVMSVTRVLRETGFDPARLELELTEGVVVEDADGAEAAMAELRALGVHLALDDFGTGYSSLIYLRRFAFDKIKIDRSFLESVEATGESAILVHSIVHLGRALGMTVTAEGVETQEQHRLLQALGCHQLQGYLFSRPLPREEVGRLLARSAGPSMSAA